MGEVESSIDYVKRMIAEQMDLISKHRASAVDESEEHDAAVEEGKKKAQEEARKQEEKEKKEEAVRLHEAKRREEIDRCLAMIRGGADKLYFDLKKLFAATPVDTVCTVFKAYRSC
eukprot:TRINITY_DN162697_c0_g1_i1.p3 TRINITY_DN162697_c0_g1~~TRINITY_DN162697_c0_g1_i1.p3  ORF type:complete len:116 (+),score=29.03 TRINITY_DN162697_c0_g1_i1:119-466(+)